jgi:hypothetical protein
MTNSGNPERCEYINDGLSAPSAFEADLEAMVCDLEAFADSLRNVRRSLEVALEGADGRAGNESRILDDVQWHRIGERGAAASSPSKLL